VKKIKKSICNQKLIFCLLVGLLLSLLLVACSTDKGAVEPRWLVLVTTQELEDSGLLDAVLPPFEQSTGVRVKRLALTTAKALDYAGLAGVDVVLLPAGSAFDKLAGPAPTIPAFQPQPYPTPTAAVAGPGPAPAPQPLGYLFNERRLALWSAVVLLAPSGDPLNLHSSPDVASALKQIALTNSRFYAPDSQSEPGYAVLEQRLWNLIGRGNPADRGTGYRQIEGDINSVMKQAATDQAYMLATAASFYTSGTENKLGVAFSNDYTLFLPYEVIVPNDTTTQDRDVKLARNFVSYLTNQKAQAIITQLSKPPFGAFFRPYYHSVYLPPLSNP
jgi:tungstate transport system substrate-binding protein